MRSHEQIVIDAGPDASLAELIGARHHQVRDWRLRKSIPAEWWAALASNKIATLEELAADAQARRLERVA